MVVGESLLLVLAGIAIGVPIAIMVTQWLSAWFFGLEHSDASTFAAAICLMLGERASPPCFRRCERVESTRWLRCAPNDADLRRLASKGLRH